MSNESSQTGQLLNSDWKFGHAWSSQTGQVFNSDRKSGHAYAWAEPFQKWLSAKNEQLVK